MFANTDHINLESTDRDIGLRTVAVRRRTGRARPEGWGTAGHRAVAGTVGRTALENTAETSPLIYTCLPIGHK